jgi:hypothetical protein
MGTMILAHKKRCRVRLDRRLTTALVFDRTVRESLELAQVLIDECAPYVASFDCLGFDNCNAIVVTNGHATLQCQFVKALGLAYAQALKSLEGCVNALVLGCKQFHFLERICQVSFVALRDSSQRLFS